MLSFKSIITQKILTYFFVNVGAKNYINELARNLEVDPKNLFRKLKEMEIEGLLVGNIIGKQKYYYLNKSFILLNQYKEIFNKTLGIEAELKRIVDSNKGILQAYIFGSYAKNKVDFNSDIDLLVVGDFSVVEIAKEISKIEKIIKRDINLLSLSQKEFQKRRVKNGDLIEQILKDKIIQLK